VNLWICEFVNLLLNLFVFILGGLPTSYGSLKILSTLKIVDTDLSGNWWIIIF